ncbi:protein of unknown function [Aminobacter niigataensis]|nr:protein of unknown function [Aminobacter niigataensis]
MAATGWKANGPLLGPRAAKKDLIRCREPHIAPRNRRLHRTLTSVRQICTSSIYAP